MRPTCQLCGKRPARFVCSRCGKHVCERCFDTSTWLCSSCLEEALRERAQLYPAPFPMGWLLLGFLLFSLGAVLMAIGAALSGQPGVLVVFPFFFVMSGITQLVVWVMLIFLVLLLISFFVLALLGLRGPWS